MAGFLLATLIVLTSVGLPVYGDTAQTAQTRDLRVTDATSQVTLEPAENSKAPASIDEDTPLQENDVIVTGPTSQAELTMDGETVIKLEPGTRFKVLKIFPANTQFEVSQGGMIAKVKPVPMQDDAIIIKLPTAVVAIRGTEFAAQTANGVSQVGVFDEGHVAVAGAWGHEHVLLEPNQETAVPLSNVPKTPQALSHFRSMRGQMVHVRERYGYWRQHWTPMSPAHRAQIRERMSAQIHAPLKTGFQHSAMRARQAASAHVQHHHAAPAHQVTHHTIHPAVHHATHKPVRHAPARHRVPQSRAHPMRKRAHGQNQN